MPNFQYSALDARGDENTGCISAASEAEAIQQLRATGLYPTQIHEEGKGKGKEKGDAEAIGGPSKKKRMDDSQLRENVERDLKRWGMTLREFDTFPIARLLILRFKAVISYCKQIVAVLVCAAFLFGPLVFLVWGASEKYPGILFNAVPPMKDVLPRIIRIVIGGWVWLYFVTLVWTVKPTLELLADALRFRIANRIPTVGNVRTALQELKDSEREVLQAAELRFSAIEAQARSSAKDIAAAGGWSAPVDERDLILTTLPICDYVAELSPGTPPISYSAARGLISLRDAQMLWTYRRERFISGIPESRQDSVQLSRDIYLFRTSLTGLHEGYPRLWGGD